MSFLNIHRLLEHVDMYNSVQVDPKVLSPQSCDAYLVSYWPHCVNDMLTCSGTSECSLTCCAEWPTCKHVSLAIGERGMQWNWLLVSGRLLL